MPHACACPHAGPRRTAPALRTKCSFTGFLACLQPFLGFMPAVSPKMRALAAAYSSSWAAGFSMAARSRCSGICTFCFSVFAGMVASASATCAAAVRRRGALPSWSPGPGRAFSSLRSRPSSAFGRCKSLGPLGAFQERGTARDSKG